MRKIAFYFSLFFLSAGCAGGLDYEMLNTHMQNNSCVAAVEYVEQNESLYGSNEKILFFLDAGMVHMLCGNHEKSNEYLHLAEELAMDLRTKSLSKETASFFVNDYTRPYVGEDFEKTLVNLFSALNYISLDKFDEALVEIRRLNSFLNELNDEYAEKNVYKEDAFGRYLSGIIYEADNSPDDAYIDYFKALKAFIDYRKNYGMSIPGFFLEDLSRIAEEVDRSTEIRPYLQEFDNIAWLKQDETKGLGKIIFIQFNGKAPVKEEDKIVLPGEDGPVTISFPRYSVRDPLCSNSTIIVKNALTYVEAETELVEDINKIAVKNLDDRKGRIIAKTLVRIVAKRLAINAATKDKNGRMLLNIADIFIERADLRTWRTLPGEIHMGRLFLPEGEYDLSLSRCGNTSENVALLNLKKGETRFVVFESMY